MNKISLTTAVALLSLSALPLSAQTQTRPPQPQQEVGGAAGALSGGNVGNAPTFSAEDRTYYRTRLMRENVPSARFEGNVVVGTELPSSVRYYDVENDPRFTNYRYTRLNDRYVLVNRQNRVVAVFE